MNHGAAFLAVNNDPIQDAIESGADRETVKYLKQEVAWYAVYGFEYAETDFAGLGYLLVHDYGFTPFKYKSPEEGAIYDFDKHPDAWGGVRGRDNVNNAVSWLCLDIDESDLTGEEIHSILSEVNHHVARTSDKSNPYKFRVIIELSKKTVVSESEWKPFTKSVADFLGLPKLDMLGRSQVFYGYKGDRELMSVTDKEPVCPDRHIAMAKMKVAEQEEKEAFEMPPEKRAAALLTPYSTFDFAYNAPDGQGTTNLMAAVHKAKKYGADKEYLVELIHKINNFWDHPMPIQRLQSTIMSAI